MDTISTVKNKIYSLKKQQKKLFFGLLVFSLVTGLLLGWYVIRQRSNSLADAKVTPKILVLPHHDLLIKEFPGFYQIFSDVQKNQVNRVILLSPNHFQPEQQRVISTNQPLSLGNGSLLAIDEDLIEPLETAKVVFDPTVFNQEHGVAIHLPFIQKTFPNAKVVPLLLTRNIPSSVRTEFSSVIEELMTSKNTIMIVSVDFSHGLSVIDAAKNDQKMMRYVQSQDSNRVANLNDEYVDCPFCMSIALDFVKKFNLTGPQEHFHSDAASYMWLGDQSETTSYFVWSWQ